MKKIFAVLLAFCLLFTLVGCDFIKDVADSTKIEESKVFDFDGISIELTTDFLRMDFVSEDYEFIVGNEDLTIMGIKIPNSETEMSQLTVTEFAENFRSLLMQNNEVTEIAEMDEIPTMQYCEDSDEGEQTVAMMYYKATDCFWIVCFAAFSDEFDDMYDDICKYAKTVKCE